MYIWIYWFDSICVEVRENLEEYILSFHPEILGIEHRSSDFVRVPLHTDPPSLYPYNATLVIHSANSESLNIFC